MGPVLTVDLEGGQLLAWGALLVHHMGKRANCSWCQSCAEGRKGGLIVFEWDPNDYRPGLGSTSDLAEAADVIGFATAYAERGEEFNRAPSEAEQRYRSWWAKYGETFQLEADYMSEEN
tara:strand:+ start:160 stop:516 length:357 start_codon:yes stop_codon:yes gene_type:complete